MVSAVLLLLVEFSQGNVEAPQPRLLRPQLRLTWQKTLLQAVWVCSIAIGQDARVVLQVADEQIEVYDLIVSSRLVS